MAFIFRWTNRLKVLGVSFSNYDSKTSDENFESKLRSIQGIMHSWRKRYLTVRGRIVIVKSLLLPKLTHALTALPKPSLDFTKRLKTECILLCGVEKRID